PRSALLPIDPLGTSGAPYGVHPSMPGLQELFQSGKAAFVANVGPLIMPVTKQQYQSGAATLPPQLFSHNDQQDQWHSLRGRNTSKTGWAGRLADVINPQLPNQQLSVNVSLFGNTYFQAADTVSPYVMGTNGPVAFAGFGTSGNSLARRQSFEAISNQNFGTIYERGFAAVNRRALQFAERVNAAIAAARNFVALPNNATGVTLSPLEQQLRTVAKLIDSRNMLSMTRQVFFVATGGFDSHDDQNQDQPGLLANVSSALKRFYDATVEMGVQDAVTTFTQSDFGRTLTSNGDGSDHAWGGVQIVVGGSVRGQQIYGNYPLLAVGGPEDVGGGRFIPSTSCDQYVATLARWFGVTDAQMPQVAPSIGNFANRYLGFLG
ncbi:MAG: DUF1501 domain-containing protein, partial [Steroidobacteraceae bacterium]|nr:DUF1501 domain-containing protein [Steroidobacteraceae bacterium]